MLLSRAIFFTTVQLVILVLATAQTFNSQRGLNTNSNSLISNRNAFGNTHNGLQGLNNFNGQSSSFINSPLQQSFPSHTRTGFSSDFSGGRFSSFPFSQSNGFNRPIPRPTLIDANGLPIQSTEPRILPSFGGPPQFGNLAPSSHVITSFLSLDSDQINPRNSFNRSPFGNQFTTPSLLTNPQNNNIFNTQSQNLLGNRFNRIPNQNRNSLLSTFGNEFGGSQSPFVSNNLNSGFNFNSQFPSLNNQLNNIPNRQFGINSLNNFGQNPLVSRQFNNFDNNALPFGQSNLHGNSFGLPFQQGFSENLIPPFSSPLQQFMLEEQQQAQLRQLHVQRQLQLQQLLLQNGGGNVNQFQGIPGTQLTPRTSFLRGSSKNGSLRFSNPRNTPSVSESAPKIGPLKKSNSITREPSRVPRNGGSLKASQRVRIDNTNKRNQNINGELINRKFPGFPGSRFESRRLLNNEKKSIE